MKTETMHYLTQILGLMNNKQMITIDDLIPYGVECFELAYACAKNYGCSVGEIIGEALSISKTTDTPFKEAIVSAGLRILKRFVKGVDDTDG